MADVKALAESLVSLTVKEVQELADVLKADYGIEPAAAAVVVELDDWVVELTPAVDDGTVVKLDMEERLVEAAVVTEPVVLKGQLMS